MATAATAAVAGLAASPAGASPRVVPAGAVMSVGTAPVSLAVPVDGRLDTYGVAAEVLGVATGPALGSVAAGRGQRLWAFGLRWSTSPLRGVSASVVLVADGIRTPVPLLGGSATAAQTAPMYWVASVPAGAPDVTIQLASGGFVQTFSLSRMRREGPQPAALYRTAGSWETTVTEDMEVTLPVPDASGGLPDGTLPVHLNSLSLSYFGPLGATDTPPAPASAWLNLNLSSIDDNTAPDCFGSCFLYFLSAVPARHVTLTRQGAAAETATVIPNLGSDIAGEGIFPGVYTFPVPVTLSTATLTINPDGIPTTPAFSGANAIPVESPPAVFHIALPAPSRPPAGTATRPAFYDTTSPGPAAAGSSRSSNPAGQSDGTLVGDVIVVVVAAAVVVGLLVRARLRHPVPAGATGATTGRVSFAPPTGPPSSSYDHRPPTTAPPPWRPAPGSPMPPPGRAETGPEVGDHPHAGRAPRHESQHDGRSEGTPPAPLPAAPAPPTEAGGEVVAGPSVAVLGPVRVAGWAEPPRGPAVAEVVVFLACHADRPVSVDRLRAGLSQSGRADPDGPELTAATARSYVARARRALGADRLVTEPDGYRLAGVTLDWDVFVAGLRAGVAAEAAGDADAARRHLAGALDLVAGRPFADGCGWAETEGLTAVIDRAVADAGTRLGRLALDAGDVGAAARAVEAGLAAAPCDEPLTALAIDVAAVQGRLVAAWTQIRAAWADHDLAVPAHLAARYHQATARTLGLP